VSCVAYSPDGALLASGSTNRLTLWKLEDGQFTRAQQIDHKAGGMWSVAFSPDSKYLAAALSNGSVKVWVREDDTWTETYNIYRHNDNVFDVTFRSDGRLLATASSDQSAIFWRCTGVGPNPIIELLQALALPFSGSQRLIVNQMTSRQIMVAIDPALSAPKDEFETTKEYERRKQLLSSHVLHELQQGVERHFGARQIDTRRIQTGLDSLQSYDADSQVYRLLVLGTEARISIPPSEARALKIHEDEAQVLIDKTIASDTVSHDYGHFTLIHPTSGKGYPIVMDENPFRGSYAGDVDETGEVGELGPSVASGPKITLENLSFDAVYPVFYKYYDDHPIGSAVLRNSGSVPVENIQVRLFIKQYMDNPKICEVNARLDSGATEEVTLYGLFTNRVLEITEGNKVSVLITVDYTVQARRYTQEFVETIRMHNRNAMTWDDDRKVAAFVTSKDNGVLKFSKNVAGMTKNESSRALNDKLLLGIALFEALNLYGMSYVVDPTTPHREFSRDGQAVDFLQFPRQTLEYRAGDCDDLSVLYNALMESVGIDTAFMTIPGHIFVAFSLDMKREEALKVFSNENDLLYFNDSAWVPLETTALGDGFLRAWMLGAQQWRDTPEKKSSVFSTRSAWKVFEPVGFFGNTDLVLPDSNAVLNRYTDEVNRLVRYEITDRERQLLSEIERDGENLKTVNRLGVLYARYGLEDAAVEQFNRVLNQVEYLPSLMNLGNVYFIRGEYRRAQIYYERAHVLDPENGRVLLLLTRVFQRTGDRSSAEEAFSTLSKVDPDLAEQYDYLKDRAFEGGRASTAVETADMIWDD
jgi:hypothetical protein